MEPRLTGEKAKSSSSIPWSTVHSLLREVARRVFTEWSVYPSLPGVVAENFSLETLWWAMSSHSSLLPMKHSLPCVETTFLSRRGLVITIMSSPKQSTRVLIAVPTASEMVRYLLNLIRTVSCSIFIFTGVTWISLTLSQPLLQVVAEFPS